MTTALMTRRLDASDHCGEPAARARDRGSRSTIVLRDPLFAIVTGTEPLAAEHAQVYEALSSIETHARATGALRLCAAVVEDQRVTIAATTGMAFRVRGETIECLADGRDADVYDSFPARAGDLYALCSTGLVDAIAIPRIQTILRSEAPAPALARRLLAFANQTQAPRDAAVAVFRLRTAA